MNPYKLIVSIVPGGAGQRIAEAGTEAGATGGTILPARGTASSTLLSILGIGSSDKEILLTVVECDRAEALCEALRAHSFEGKHRSLGILFMLDVLDFFRSGEPLPTTSGEPTMKETEPDQQVLTVIVNKNYADEAMAAARKAGATGGTVLSARGTARPEDETFFGVPLVPEKEVLIILAEKEQAQGILAAIRALPCFAEKGSGVAFRLPVCEAMGLGGK